MGIGTFSCLFLGCVFGVNAVEALIHPTGVPFSSTPVIPVQVPFEAPPEPEFPDVPKATPAPETLTPEELKRAEALLSLLEGRQELYAMGEFVHLGKPVVPVLVKALTMSGPRVRYNAIETLKIINDPSAIPFLLESASNPEEMTRIRTHALRVAVKLDPTQALLPPAFRKLVKDDQDTVRRTVAFEARHVKQVEVPPLLIELLEDPQRYVAVTALESFWVLTRYAGKPHNWQASTQEQRKMWAMEWREWWESNLLRQEESGGMTSKGSSS